MGKLGSVHGHTRPPLAESTRWIEKLKGDDVIYVCAHPVAGVGADDLVSGRHAVADRADVGAGPEGRVLDLQRQHDVGRRVLAPAGRFGVVNWWVMDDMSDTTMRDAWFTPPHTSEPHHVQVVASAGPVVVVVLLLGLLRLVVLWRDVPYAY